jgi:hypothetical protein
MSEESHRPSGATSSGPVAGERWGDPIAAERQDELKALADQQLSWAQGGDPDRKPSLMAGARLSGADLFWLAAYVLTKPEGDVTAVLNTLRVAALDRDALRTLDLNRLVTRLAMLDLWMAILPDAPLAGAGLVGDFIASILTPPSGSGVPPDTLDEVHDEDDEAVRGALGPHGSLEESPQEQPAAKVADSIAPDTPTPADSPTQPLEHVAFTSHYPREVSTQIWERLLVFIALDTPAAAAQVEAMAAERLRRPEDYRAAAAPSSSSSLRRGTRLTIVPGIPGFRADPASLTGEWTDDAQCYEFRIRTEEARPGLAVNGSIQVLEGPILRGEIPLAVFVRADRQPTLAADRTAITYAAAYRKTFPSYSRRDEPLVRAFETVVEATGDRFLRDVRTLRAGEQWAATLLMYIDQADVFQLFWSSQAAASHQVEREWRYALEHLNGRPNFIRPVYWTRQPYPVPPELIHLNFARLDSSVLSLPSPSRWAGIFRRGERS